MHGHNPAIRQAAVMLRQSNLTVALTGAGISTPSGIPDFRSLKSGLWQRNDPMQVASLAAFRYHPERFFSWVRPLARSILQAAPNSAHLALAQLEQAGHLAGVITQNIDGLHNRAGSTNVFEIHGHLRQATCVRCFRRVPSGRLLASFVERGDIPQCGHCHGTLKPDVVLYGEQLPYLVVQDAQQLVEASELVIVIGSSLEVTPAAVFPVHALNGGANLIIINETPTYLDERATVVIRDDVAAVLPALAREVLHTARE